MLSSVAAAGPVSTNIKSIIQPICTPEPEQYPVTMQCTAEFCSRGKVFSCVCLNLLLANEGTGGEISTLYLSSLFCIFYACTNGSGNAAQLGVFPLWCFRTLVVSQFILHTMGIV